MAAITAPRIGTTGQNVEHAAPMNCFEKEKWANIKSVEYGEPRLTDPDSVFCDPLASESRARAKASIISLKEGPLKSRHGPSMVSFTHLDENLAYSCVPAISASVTL